MWVSKVKISANKAHRLETSCNFTDEIFKTQLFNYNASFIDTQHCLAMVLVCRGNISYSPIEKEDCKSP